MLNFAIRIVAALLPAILLLVYIRKKDRLEPEPPRLIRKLVLGGVLAIVPAIILEDIVSSVLDATVPQGTVLYATLEAFVVAAMVEEACKLFFLHRFTWKDPNFNCWFDGIVYAVAVSLGFAALENVLYVLQGGLTVALMRAILSIPGHMGFAVFMGMRYSRAKFWQMRGDPARAKQAMLSAYLLAVLMHGIYDACLMINTGWSNAIFDVFVIAMDLVVWCSIKRDSATDRSF